MYNNIDIKERGKENDVQVSAENETLVPSFFVGNWGKLSVQAMRLFVRIKLLCFPKCYCDFACYISA